MLKILLITTIWCAFMLPVLGLPYFNTEFKINNVTLNENDLKLAVINFINTLMPHTSNISIHNVSISMTN